MANAAIERLLDLLRRRPNVLEVGTAEQFAEFAKASGLQGEDEKNFIEAALGLQEEQAAGVPMSSSQDLRTSRSKLEGARGETGFSKTEMTDRPLGRPKSDPSQTIKYKGPTRKIKGPYPEIEDKPASEKKAEPKKKKKQTKKSAVPKQVAEKAKPAKSPAADRYGGLEYQKPSRVPQNVGEIVADPYGGLEYQKPAKPPRSVTTRYGAKPPPLSAMPEAPDLLRAGAASHQDAAQDIVGQATKKLPKAGGAAKGAAGVLGKVGKAAGPVALALTALAVLSQLSAQGAGTKNKNRLAALEGGLETSLEEELAEEEGSAAVEAQGLGQQQMYGIGALQQAGARRQEVEDLLRGQEAALEALSVRTPPSLAELMGVL